MMMIVGFSSFGPAKINPIIREPTGSATEAVKN